jgi:phosphoglucomutase
MQDGNAAIVPALLAAEITSRMDRDPGEIYCALTREFGEPVYDRVEAPATPKQKEKLERRSGSSHSCGGSGCIRPLFCRPMPF